MWLGLSQRAFGGAPCDDVVWVKCGPEHKGWPTCRQRLLAALVVKKRWRWVGPPTQELVLSEFRQRFFRSTSAEMTGSTLFFESDQERLTHYAEISNSRPGHRDDHLTVKDLREMESWELLMLLGPPGFGQRLAEWKGIHKIGEGLEEDFLLDADHWPRFGGCGRYFPTQITHSTIMKFAPDGSWKVATCAEHLQAMGFNNGGGESRHTCTIQDIDFGQGLRPGEFKHLIGNGMHLHSIACFMSFTFGNIERA